MSAEREDSRGPAPKDPAGSPSSRKGPQKGAQPAEGQKPARPADPKFTFKILPANPRGNSTDFEDVADK